MIEIIRRIDVYFVNSDLVAPMCDNKKGIIVFRILFINLNKKAMRKILLFFLVFCGFLLSASGQQKTISGTVTGAEDGQPVIGCTVQLKGMTIGTITNTDGKYTLNAPEAASALVFSYVGMKSIEVPISGRNVIDVVLESDIMGLNEVVVTALGISRERKSLGYATQEVKGDEISKVKTANFANSLSGKISGVQVQRNQNMGGSTNVIVRGSKSLVNSNQVLYVVDGVPINNAIGKYTDVGVTSGQAATAAGYDYGNAACRY